MTPCSKNDLPEILYKYMNDNYLCDVTIVVFGGIRLSAHSLVLATVSSKLRAAFERTHKGGSARRPNWGYRLTIEECSLESVRAILQFVYTGSIHLALVKDTNSTRQMLSESNPLDPNLQELFLSQPINSESRNTHLCFQQNDCNHQIINNDLKAPNALGILHAGQKLGLDPIKLASCLKAMMENGSLNIEDTTPYLLTDEDIILDVVDKDPDIKTSENVVETMRVTSQILPFVSKDKKIAPLANNYLNENRIASSSLSRDDPVDSSKVQTTWNPCLKSGSIQRDVGETSASPPVINSNRLSNKKNAVLKYKQMDETISQPEKYLLSKLLSRESNVSMETSMHNLKTQDKHQILKNSLTFLANSTFNYKNSASLLNCLHSSIAQHGDLSSISLDQDGENRTENAKDDYLSNLKVIPENTKSLPSKIPKENKMRNAKKNPNKCDTEKKQEKNIECPTGGQDQTDVLQTQDVAKPYQCDICGRSFARRYTAIEHKRLHSGEKPYQCDRCGKRFTTCGDLTKHRRCQHSAVKPHVCSICGKEMSTGREVADHKRLHEGGNRCPVCQKTFTRLHNMKEHLRGTHQGYRPFSCPYCDKKFVYSGSLRFHKKQHRMAAQDELNRKPPSKQNPKRCKTSERRQKCSRDSDLRTEEHASYQTKHSQFSSRNVQGNESCVFSDSEDINRFAFPSNSTSGIGRSTSVVNEGMLESNGLRSQQERMEVSPMEALQDHVLVDLALSGMIGFGATD